MTLVDTHCHLYMFEKENERDQIVSEASNNGIHRIMVPGIDLQTSLEAIKLSEKYEIVYAAIGYHPNSSNEWKTESKRTLLELSQHPKVKAIGEIGLDFYRDLVSFEIQEKIFLEHLEIAEATNLPIIIHSRNALPQIFNILIKKHKSSSTKLRGVVHSFEGNLNQANQLPPLDFYIGLGGPVTYKNAFEKHELARKFPIEWLLLETDSPFLSPHPVRGLPNKPMNIKYISERIANLSEKPLKWISQETTKNANRLFAWEH